MTMINTALQFTGAENANGLVTLDVGYSPKN